MNILGISFTWGFELYWKAWLAVVLIGFAVPEYFGLKTERGDTLSEWMVRWFNADQGHSFEKTVLLFIVISLVVVAVWLVGHWYFLKWGWHTPWDGSRK